MQAQVASLAKPQVGRGISSIAWLLGRFLLYVPFRFRLHPGAAALPPRRRHKPNPSVPGVREAGLLYRSVASQTVIPRQSSDIHIDRASLSVRWAAANESVNVRSDFWG